MRANPTRRPEIGDTVHIMERWPCRFARVIGHPRRGLDVAVGAAPPVGVVVLAGLRRDLGRRPGTWHPHHLYGPTYPRSSRPVERGPRKERR